MIEVKLTFQNEDELIAFFARDRAAGSTPEVKVSAPKAEEAKPKSTPKETKAAPPESAASQTTAAEPAAQPEKGASSEKPLDYEKDIKPKFLKLVAEKGRDVALTLVPKFSTGGKSIADCAPERYPELLAAILELAAS